MRYYFKTSRNIASNDIITSVKFQKNEAGDPILPPDLQLKKPDTAAH